MQHSQAVQVTWLTGPATSIMRSLVPGKKSLVRDSWILALDCSWNSAGRKAASDKEQLTR